MNHILWGKGDMPNKFCSWQGKTGQHLGLPKIFTQQKVFVGQGENRRGHIWQQKGKNDT